MCMSCLLLLGIVSSQPGTTQSLWTHSCNYLLSELLIKREQGFNFFKLVCLLELVIPKSAFFFHVCFGFMRVYASYAIKKKKNLD